MPALLSSQGIQVRIMDSRDNPPYLPELVSHFPEVKYHLGDWNPLWLYEADVVVVSPGLKLSDPLLQKRLYAVVLVFGVTLSYLLISSKCLSLL